MPATPTTLCPGCGARVRVDAAACPACGEAAGSGLPTRATGPAEDLRAQSRTAPTPVRLEPGTVLAGRYRIIEMLGHGGMGEVFRAEDLSLGQPVAVKLLPERLAHEPRALERVREEVRMARRVSHPNVCRVHDLGEAGAQVFISMEYVDGEDLATLLRRVGRLAGDRGLEVAREVCAGLAAAHASGVIHRDLKPANVMIDRRGRVRIADFGLARLGQEGDRPGEFAGTPPYMAPEQLAGAGASVRSDLYALGLVLYELFTGRRAFPAADSLEELIRVRREAPIAAPRSLVPELDPGVERTILACLAARVEDRPETAIDVLTALTSGDPLKAALAAGQTPSPSAVAGARVRGALSAPAAWAWVLAVLAGLVAVLTLSPRTSMLGRCPLPLPPAALAVKAEEAVRALAPGGTSADHDSSFDYDEGAIRAAQKQVEAPVTRAGIVAAERHIVVFRHRSSPVPLVPRGIRGRVSRDDPAPGPGDASVVLDAEGRLLEFRTLPVEGEAPPPPTNSVERFFQLAGMAEPPGTPRSTHESRSVYEARIAESGIPVSVEVRQGEGGLEYARVVAPWTAPLRPRRSRVIEAEDVFDLTFLVLLLLSLPLAWRNVRSGRVDRQGARRVGLLVLACELAALILMAHHPATVGGEIGLLIRSASWSLFYGATAALFYVALEPFVRRVSPERLVSWERLLAGNVGDPMVARDILVGIAVFFVNIVLATLPMVVPERAPFIPTRIDLGALLGPEMIAGMTFSIVAFTVRSGLWLFLLLLLALRPAGRVRWAGPTLFFLLAFAVTVANVRAMGAPAALAAVFAATTAAAWVFLLTRFGLLAMIANLFARSALFVTGGSTRLVGWAAPNAWFFVGTLVLLSLYGLYFATGRRPFGDRTLLEA